MAEDALDRLPLRDLLAALPLAAATLGADGRVEDANEQLASLLGLPPGQLPGRSLDEWLDPAGRGALGGRLKGCLAGGPGHRAAPLELLLRVPGAPAVPVEAAVSRLPGGEARALVCVRDLSEQRRAQQQLEDSEERFRQIAENVREVFWMTPPDKNRILYVSPAYEAVWGRPVRELHENPRNWLDAIHPEDRPRVLEAALRQAAGRYDEEYRIVRPDGSLRWIRDRAFPVRDASGAVYRIAGLAEDVTEGRRALEQQQRSAELLESRVAQRTAELQAAIRSLQQTEARHQALLAAIPDLVLRIARDGTYLDVWSPQGAAFAGFERRVGWNVHGTLPPDAAEIGMAAVRRALETGGPVSHEYTLRVGEELRHLEGRSAPSGPDEVVVVTRDITERKRTEEALRLGERRIRQVIDLVPHFVFAKDAEGRYILANQAVADAYGTRVENLLGRTDADFARSPDEARRFREDDIEVIRRGRTKLVPEELMTDAGGRVRSLQTVKIPFTFSGTDAPAVLGVSTDISELKRAERALRAGEDRYRDLFENANDVICTFDLEGRLTSVNRKGELLTGYSRQELLRLPLPRLVAPASLAAAGDSLRRRLKGEPSTFEVEILARDGRVLPLDVSVRLMREEGRAVAVQAIARDVGERRLLEERLRQSQRLEAMGALVAGVAHEVRNPLFAMAATLDAYEARFPGGGEFRRYVEALRTELDRLTVLMQDLLDFGKPPIVELKPGSVQDAVDDAVRACGPLEARLGVRVEVVRENELPAVALDRPRLGQAIRNLVENALEHSPAGRAVTVRVRAARLGEASVAECVVEDAGPGFAAEDLPRVFEPFFTRRRGGTGLGLSIVQRIVEQHHGTLSLGNRPGGGAVVSLRLPGAAS